MAPQPQGIAFRQRIRQANNNSISQRGIAIQPVQQAVQQAVQQPVQQPVQQAVQVNPVQQAAAKRVIEKAISKAIIKKREMKALRAKKQIEQQQQALQDRSKRLQLKEKQNRAIRVISAERKTEKEPSRQMKREEEAKLRANVKSNLKVQKMGEHMFNSRKLLETKALAQGALDEKGKGVLQPRAVEALKAKAVAEEELIYDVENDESMHYKPAAGGGEVSDKSPIAGGNLFDDILVPVERPKADGSVEVVYELPVDRKGNVKDKEVITKVKKVLEGLTTDKLTEDQNKKLRGIINPIAPKGKKLKAQSVKVATILKYLMEVFP